MANTQPPATIAPQMLPGSLGKYLQHETWVSAAQPPVLYPGQQLHRSCSTWEPSVPVVVLDFRVGNIRIMGCAAIARVIVGGLG